METRKVIRTPRQRLRWLVNFASVDLSALSRGDQFKIREELRDVLLPLKTSLAPGGLHTYPDPEAGPPPEEYPPTELAALQAEMHEAFERTIRSRVDPEALPVVQLPTLRYRAPYVPPDRGMPERHCLSVTGNVRDLVWVLLLQLLATEDTAALAKCPECDRVFLRQTNQRYCSKTCANRVGQRAWRERQETPVAEGVVH
jgi:hypothetical protein